MSHSFSRSLRLVRAAIGVALVMTLALALFLTTRGLGLWEGSFGAGVSELHGDEQEIAWIEPATNNDEWAQLTAGLTRLETDWPHLEGTHGTLRVDLGREPGGAFPQRSADVAEVALYFAEVPAQKLWLRWYKISGDNPVAMWLDKLRGRRRPPLAIAGGGSSDRAFRLARTLAATAQGWPGQPPLLLITNATTQADRPLDAGTAGERLMEIYPGRTFRFCFSNSVVVEAVLGFLRENPHVWLEPDAASAGAVAAGDLWTALGLLHAGGHLGPKLFSVRWQDDSYSRDLELLFRTECRHWHPFATQNDLGALPYSVGDVYLPNASEQRSVDLFLSLHPPPPRSLLVLPTSAQQMRRYLSFLCQQAPALARNLVVVNGDAITFHNVYRDRDFAWNVFEMPVPVVFFTHRNPVDPNAASNWSFAWQRDEQKKHSTTGTHDLLLDRDVVEALLYAAFADGRVLGEIDRVQERLRHTCWRGAPTGAAPNDSRYNRVQNDLVQHDPVLAGHELFDALGDRRRDTGEHIVWLRPNFHDKRLDGLEPCTISVWRHRAASAGPTWYEIDSHSPPYNQGAGG